MLHLYDFQFYCNSICKFSEIVNATSPWNHFSFSRIFFLMTLPNKIHFSNIIYIMLNIKLKNKKTVNSLGKTQQHYPLFLYTH